MFEHSDPNTLNYVGHSPERQEDQVKLTGAAIYASDMSLPGMLHAQIKKSPHASAKIRKIDVSKAEQLPGVRAILTGDDLDYRLGLYVVDKDILAKGFVGHYGEAVVAVATDTLAIAKQENEAAIRRWLACRQHDEWPTGYEGIRMLDVA